MTNAEYWEGRFTQLENAQHNIAQKSYSEIEQQFNEAKKMLDGQIALWYQEFAANNNITMAEAEKYLQGDALAEFKWDVNDYIKYAEDNQITGAWKKQLANASAKFHVTKLEALKIHTQNTIENLYMKQFGTVSQAVKDVYTSGYYHGIFELQKGYNIGFDIAAIDQSQLEKIMVKPWAKDGYNFSQRIWKYKDKLISTVHEVLTQNIQTGSNPLKAIKSIAEVMKTTGKTEEEKGKFVKYAGRLVMTETAYFSSLSLRDCFEELDVEQFEIVATLDDRTSQRCKDMDGKIFDLKDYQVNVTAPPFHVYCRSTMVPYLGDDFGKIGERAARNEDVQTYYIPDDIKYQEWEDIFVKGGDKSKFDVKDIKGTTHYSYHEEPKPTPPPPPPKKTYLTKKKLQANIADAEVQIEDLQNQFEAVSGGWSYADVIKDFGTLEDFADGDDLTKLKDIHAQIEDIEQQKADWQTKLDEKLKKEQKKLLTKQQNDLESQKDTLEQQLNNLDVKTYSGIWKNDVTTADFANLNIQGKKDYYTQQIAYGGLDPAKQAEFEGYIKQLEELEKEGKIYADVQKQLNKVKSDLQKVSSDLQNLKNGGIINPVDDAFSQDRKDAALWAKSTKEADTKLRSVCGNVWSTASKAEKDAIYEYTSSYSKFNEPLRGIEYGTNAYKGVGNVDLDNIGVSYKSFSKGEVRKQINYMTDIIEKSTYDFDIWLQRGCGFNGMDNFFQISSQTLQCGTQAELEQELMGKTVTDYGFFSCGVSKGKGFSHKPIILNVYAPKGTKMMYAEPFSSFGNGDGRQWNGVSPQSSFGNESEIILQQGTSFRITKVERDSSKIYIDVEVVAQNAPQR